MLSYFPFPYEDEIFYSWFSRYHVHSGNYFESSTNLDLFNVDKPILNLSFPRRLDYLCSQLPKNLSISSDYIIENHTLIPFFKPFILEENLDSICHVMKTTENVTFLGNINRMLGVSANKLFNENIIRICPLCYEEDIKKYGECYIHKNHIIPGVFICLIHKCCLVEFNMMQLKGKRYIPLSKNIKSYSTISDNNEINNRTIEFTQSLILLQEGVLSNIGLNEIIIKINGKLLELGYIKRTVLDRKALLFDFLNFYPLNLLKLSNSNMDFNDKSAWIYLISSNRKEKFHPVRYMLLINFLFGNLENFLNYNEDYHPFGISPWPCLNPVCPNYQRNVIDNCSVNYHNYKYIGIFKCSCGFTYKRLGPDKTKDDRFKAGAILEFGPLWTDQFKDLIVNKRYSIKKTERHMKCGYNTVISKAEEFGILHLLNLRKPVQHKGNKMKALSSEDIDNYKNKIITYIKNNPKTTRSQISKIYNKEYSTLIKSYREWFEENMPPKLRKELNCQNYNSPDFWSNKDTEIYEKVTRIIEQIKLDPSTKISCKSIIKHLNYHCIANPKYFPKLPKVKELIQKSVESDGEFFRRKFDFQIKELVNQDIALTLNYTFFLKNLNMTSYTFSKYKVIIYDVVNKYLN